MTASPRVMPRVPSMPARRLRLLSYMTPGFPVSLFERIAATIDADLELDQSRSGPAADEDPFRDGQADLGWICSTSFVELATRSPDSSLRLVGVAWVPDDPDVRGTPFYFGDVVVPADSPVRSLADLAGCSIGCNDDISLSGHYALLKAIVDLGARPDDFAELRFSGGHHTSLDQLVSGTLDAAVVDSVVRIGRAATDAGVAALRVVERLGPWPVQPLVARADLDDAVVAKVSAALLASTADPAMQSELRAASLVGFAPVDASHYESVRTLLAQVGIHRKS